MWARCHTSPLERSEARPSPLQLFGREPSFLYQLPLCYHLALQSIKRRCDITAVQCHPHILKCHPLLHFEHRYSSCWPVWQNSSEVQRDALEKLPTTDAVLLFLLLVHGSMLLPHNKAEQQHKEQQHCSGSSSWAGKGCRQVCSEPHSTASKQLRPAAALQLTSGITAVIQSRP